MLRINRNQKSLIPMTNQSLGEVGLKERYDLQQMMRQNADAFFAEMGEKLLLVGEEVCPTDVVDDRIDLLVVDKEAAVVVIEIKRGSNRFHLLQALSYTAMISKWEMIFKDLMTTAAVIDRLVLHSVVLELNVPSYRAEQARKRKDKDKQNPKSCPPWGTP